MRVPILTYHSLDDSGSVISVRPEVFRRQVRGLARAGFTGVALRRLCDAWDGNAKMPARPIVLTFDDGFANFAEHAAPPLAEAGFGATVFAVAGYVGKTNDWPTQPAGVPRLPLMDMGALRELSRAGFEIGAHSVTHPHLTSPDSAAEVGESKRMLEDGLGAAVQTFAYPYGDHGPETLAAVRRHFRAAPTVRMGFAYRGDDRHLLPRIEMYYFRNGEVNWLNSIAGRIYVELRALGRRLRGGS